MSITLCGRFYCLNTPCIECLENSKLNTRALKSNYSEHETELIKTVFDDFHKSLSEEELELLTEHTEGSCNLEDYQREILHGVYINSLDKYPEAKNIKLTLFSGTDGPIRNGLLCTSMYRPFSAKHIYMIKTYMAEIYFPVMSIPLLHAIKLGAKHSELPHSEMEIVLNGCYKVEAKMRKRIYTYETSLVEWFKKITKAHLSGRSSEFIKFKIARKITVLTVFN